MMRLSRLVLLILSILLLVPMTTAQSPQDLQVRIESIDANDFPTVNLEVTVLNDARSPVLGLTRDNFSITEDGAEAVIADVQPSNLGISVVLAVDTSDSMFAIAQARDAAVAFVDELGPEDSVGLIDFDTNVVTVQPLTNDREAVRVGIRQQLEQGGRTALYDGVLAAVQEAARATSGRKAVIVLADGNESGESISSRSSALDEATRLGIPVYTIGLGANADRAYLENIAALTGGQYIDAPDFNDLSQLYIDLAGRLREAYLITLDSQVPGDGRNHDLTVQVENAGSSGEANISFTATEIAPEITIPIPDEITASLTLTPDIAVQGNRYRVVWQIDGELVNDPPDVPPYALEIDAAALSPGEHVVTATVTDGGGLSASDSVTLDIPSLPPNVTVSGLSEGTQLDTRSVTVELDIASQTDIESVTFAINDETPTVLTREPYSFDIDPIDLEAGQQTLTITVQNASDTPFEQTLTFVTTLAAPTVSLVGLPEGEITEGVIIEAVIDAQTDVYEVEWQIDGEAARADNDTPNAIALDPFDFASGAAEISVTVTDDNGLSTTIEQDVTIAAVAPRLTINGLASGDMLELDPVTVSVRVDSQAEIDEVEFTLNNESAVALLDPPYTFEVDPLTLLATDSEQVLAIRVTDANGQTTLETLEFTTSAVAPTITINGLPTEPIAEQTTIQVDVTGQTAVETEWLLNNESIRPQEADGLLTYELDPYELLAGENSLVIIATDERDVQSESETTILAAALPPRIEFVGLSDGDELENDRPVSLDVSSQNEIESVTYQVGDVEPISVIAEPYTYQLDLVAIGAGEQTLRVEVVDAAGQTSTESLEFTIPSTAIRNLQPDSGDGLGIVPLILIALVVLGAVVVGVRVAGAGRGQVPGGGKVKLNYHDILTDKDTTYKITSERTLIGRASGNDIVLVDPDQRVSREHAAIESRGKSWVIVDLDSTHGIKVNGQKVDGSLTLGDQDVITIGATDLTFIAPGVTVSSQDLMKTRMEGLPEGMEDDISQTEIYIDDMPPPQRRITMMKEDETQAPSDESAPTQPNTATENRSTALKEESNAETADDADSPRSTTVKTPRITLLEEDKEPPAKDEHQTFVEEFETDGEIDNEDLRSTTLADDQNNSLDALEDEDSDKS